MNGTNCYSKQCIRREIQRVQQNFNPGLALVGLSGAGLCFLNCPVAGSLNGKSNPVCQSS